MSGAGGGGASASRAEAGTVPRDRGGGISTVGDAVVGDAVVGDAVVGSSLVGNVPVGNAPVGNAPVGDALLGDAVAGDAVAGDTVVGAAPVIEGLLADAVVGDVLVGDVGDALGSDLTGDAVVGEFVGDALAADALAADAPVGDALVGDAAGADAPATRVGLAFAMGSARKNRSSTSALAFTTSPHCRSGGNSRLSTVDWSGASTTSFHPALRLTCHPGSTGSSAPRPSIASGSAAAHDSVSKRTAGAVDTTSNARTGHSTIALVLEIASSRDASGLGQLTRSARFGLYCAASPSACTMRDGPSSTWSSLQSTTAMTSPPKRAAPVLRNPAVSPVWPHPGGLTS